MLVLFVRALIIYILIFFVIRLTGKRQLSELQPFDLVMTLLIADVASGPASNTGVPLLYGIVPILALFLLHQLMSFLSLKSEEVRKVVCGRSVMLIERGVVREGALRATRYTLNDLMEQLRSKDVFNVSDVAFAILETNGELSVLLAGEKQQPTYQAMALSAPGAAPPWLLIQDGKVHREALRMSGRDMNWLRARLARAGCKSEADAFFAFLDCNDVLHVQTMERLGARPYVVDGNAEGAAR